MEEVQSTKKKSSLGVIILVLLLMIGCLCGGYYLSAKNIIKINLGQDKSKTVKNNEINSENNVTTCDETLEVTSNDVTTLYEQMIKPEGFYCDFTKFFSDHTITVKDLTDSEVSRIMLSALYKQYNRKDEGSTYTKDEVEGVAKALFGKDFEYKHGTIEGACPAFTYDSDRGVYTVGTPACGGTCGPHGYNQVVKATKSSKEIDLYVRVIFIQDYSNMSNFSSADLNYYSDYARTKKIDLERDYYSNPYENASNLSKGSLYKMVFELEDGNYIFKSSELVNE